MNEFWDMAALSPAIAERARKNEVAILRALANVGQCRVAEMTGMSETAVSRLKGDALGQLAAVAAACGIKCVPQDMECFDPEYVRALRVMAGVGIKAPSPTLDWDA